MEPISYREDLRCTCYWLLVASLDPVVHKGAHIDPATVVIALRATATLCSVVRDRDALLQTSSTTACFHLLLARVWRVARIVALQRIDNVESGY